MRNISIFSFLFIVIAGCANGPFSENRDLDSSGQQQGQVVACGGYKTWPDCYRTAKQACPNGFEVLAKEENLPTQTRAFRFNCK